MPGGGFDCYGPLEFVCAARRSQVLVVPLLATLAACGEPGAGAPLRFAPLLGDGDAVFFVGNSFLDWDGRRLPDAFATLGQVAAPPVRIDVGAEIVPGETPLAALLPRPGVRTALASGRYKVFVLQGFEFEPVDNREAFFAAVRAFDQDVRSAGAHTALFMTWEFSFRPFIRELAEAYETIGRELQIPVIPVGLVYADCGRTPPDGKTTHWLTSDAERPEGDLHPNAAGMTASAMTTFAILTGRDPRELDLASLPSDLEDAQLRLLAECAWARAAPRLRRPGAKETP